LCPSSLSLFKFEFNLRLEVTMFQLLEFLVLTILVSVTKDTFMFIVDHLSSMHKLMWL
jgi:hypothetical protein